MVASQTSGVEVPGSNPVSSTMILGRFRIIVKYFKNLRVEGGTSTGGKKKYTKTKTNLFILKLDHFKVLFVICEAW